jgi:hypothetical protein
VEREISNFRRRQRRHERRVLALARSLRGTAARSVAAVRLPAARLADHPAAGDRPGLIAEHGQKRL